VRKVTFIILSVIIYYLLFFFIRAFLVGVNVIVGDTYDELGILNFLTVMYILIGFITLYEKKKNLHVIYTNKLQVVIFALA